MAIENEGTITPTGTGAFPDPPESVTVEQTPGHPVGTGAVDGPGEPVTTDFGPFGQDGTGASPDPEPVTHTGSYAKVVRQGRRAAPETTTGAETKAPATGSLPGVDAGH